MQNPPKPHVLVLDDSPTILAQAQLILGSQFEVTTCSNWMDANAKAHAIRPAAFVIDWQLEGFRGSFLVTAFRSFFGEAMPIVMLSSDAEGEAAAAEAGATAFLAKGDMGSLPALLARLTVPAAA